MSQPLIVGLTGGIGSGKSAAADMFAALGAAIVDADVVAHDLTGPGGAAMAAIREAFGDAVITPTGALDRTAMRQLAFTDPSARARLEAVLHPLIGAECASRMAAAIKHGAPYVIHAVPLLAESGGARQHMNRVLVVDCPEELQVSRVMARSGLAAEEVRRIMAAQAGRAVRLVIADDVIVNDGDLEALRQQVAELHAKYLATATK
ncbi:dephospho-CoA kinase [Denitratisoma oestradiolicum]|uniref:Dephospho-CoA kinase n=1 Tax=Denitratisoma oestradiolicum TaxID=311182 RepID=A0A6S6Y652_9PROT|nr:dephospho-CoA kinase [Denitratisoma oestradiolicum]TWO80655.1 dephospho-CoA kinase [Denitratisoma oestradiolicum]CAB1371059.1 dephospho-CoA kinase [Denitratisoma oestradiolicum]